MHLQAIDGGKADRLISLSARAIHANLSRTALIEAAVQRNEGRLAASGGLVVTTGRHTGRAAADKFTVKDDTTTGEIWWDNARALSPEQFDVLLADFRAHAADRELFSQDLFGGCDTQYRIAARIYCEFAWHALFIQHLLVRPTAEERSVFAPDMTIIDLPSFRADPARHGVRTDTIIAVDFTRRIVLIGGTEYAGEIKKSVFTFLNYLLPKQAVMPMHCSVNESYDGANSAVFFGLSGTGKTTLSADPSRRLVGDDEHGWSPNGVFNFEGGCYAKTIRLSKEAEPQIYDAVSRFGAVLENVILDPETGLPDFNDGRLTENTRGAYPLDFIANASECGRTMHPKNIVMLTADAFGVLPPIARLTPHQAMYHFLSGYTAKVAGTEQGVTEPQAVFSTCFGAPFMPLHPSVYGNLLRRLIAEHQVDCWLVNTGWTGGKYGVGHRMPIRATRRLLNAALSGELQGVATRTDPIFGFAVPLALEGVAPEILNPRESWADKPAYDAQAKALVDMFSRNFEKFEAYVDPDVRAAAPALRFAAE